MGHRDVCFPFILRKTKMEDALKERISVAAWDLKMFQDAGCDPQFYYLVTRAQASLKVAEDILAELINVA